VNDKRRRTSTKPKTGENMDLNPDTIDILLTHSLILLPRTTFAL